MIGYSSYSDPRLQPPDPDDRWVSIAEGLEEKYGTGEGLRGRVEEVLFTLDLAPDFASLYEANDADLPMLSERFVRRILGMVQERVEGDAREDAIAEIEAADEQAAEDAAENRYWAKADAA